MDHQTTWLLARRSHAPHMPCSMPPQCPTCAVSTARRSPEPTLRRIDRPTNKAETVHCRPRRSPSSSSAPACACSLAFALLTVETPRDQAILWGPSLSFDPALPRRSSGAFRKAQQPATATACSHVSMQALVPQQPSYAGKHREHSHGSRLAPWSNTDTSAFDNTSAWQILASMRRKTGTTRARRASDRR